MVETVPTQARVVIIGGGIIGCSIAYHLTKLGGNDVVLLELVVVLVRIRSKLDLLDGDALLMLSGFVSLPLHLVEVLPIVHDPANRWTAIGCDLDQIQTAFFC